MSDGRDELHIASLLVQHQPQGRQALRAMVEASPGLEIAVGDEARSVLLQESPDTRGLMDCVDRLRELPGVINVNLVYHHVEPREALEQPHIPESGAGHDHAS